MLAMTLLVRNEIDIIAHHIAYHLPKVDLLIVTDNGSDDGTREYLEMIKGGKVIVIDEPGRDYSQDVWVGRMIRLAISHGADWVVNSDADEFWIGNLRELVAKHGEAHNVLRVQSRLMVCTDQDTDDPSPLRRINHRLTKPRPHEAKFVQVWAKLIHSTAGWDRIFLGNHKTFFAPGVAERTAEIPEAEAHIRHYTERGWDHYRKKYIAGGEAYARSGKPKEFGCHWRDRYKVYETGGISALRDLYLAQSIITGPSVQQLCRRDPWKE
jgi:glycosyltransferase involved in cell wall biosynthesis